MENSNKDNKNTEKLPKEIADVMYTGHKDVEIVRAGSPQEIIKRFEQYEVVSIESANEILELLEKYAKNSEKI